ncbi:DNA damage-regulated autophagy modulator protein 1 [Latimeria chalumnae]|uniref:DNA damage-regulated autophagy modulator protein 1 n=1 Tax=Latimeria chalumnae TaxID=7897 RepID=UPI00313EF1E6
MLWFTKGMCFLPVFLVIWSSAAFIVPYIIAVFSGHVKPLVPYISDTGTNPPESGVFGFMVTISAVLGAATIVTKYKLLEKLNESTSLINSKCNLFALCIGILSCIGMIIVATFQETSVPIVHDIGAIVAFVLGVFYILLQSYITYKMLPLERSLFVCCFRMFLAVLSFCAIFPTIACAVLSKLQQNTEKVNIYYLTKKEKKSLNDYKWSRKKKKESGLFKMSNGIENAFRAKSNTKMMFRYTLKKSSYTVAILCFTLQFLISIQGHVFRIVSAVCEWIVAFSFIFFFFSYIREFQNVNLRIQTELSDNSFH